MLSEGGERNGRGYVRPSVVSKCTCIAKEHSHFFVRIKCLFLFINVLRLVSCITAKYD